MIRHKGTDYSCVAYILRSLLGPSFELMERYVLPTVWGVLSTSPIGDGLISVCSSTFWSYLGGCSPLNDYLTKKSTKFWHCLHILLLYTHTINFKIKNKTQKKHTNSERCSEVFTDKTVRKENH